VGREVPLLARNHVAEDVECRGIRSRVQNVPEGVELGGQASERDLEWSVVVHDHNVPRCWLTTGGF
jgi:hypothetical protein